MGINGRPLDYHGPRIPWQGLQPAPATPAVMPQPVDIAFTANLAQSGGEKKVCLTIFMPTGATVVFIPIGTVEALCTLLKRTASGVIVATPGDLPAN